ncbi:GAF domain-containing protein [Archaeoglobus sp.]
MPQIPREKAEVIFEEWFGKVSKELPPEIVKIAKIKIGSVIIGLLSGDKTVKEAIGEFDKDLLYSAIKSGRRPLDVVKNMSILMEMVSSKIDDPEVFRNIVIILANYQAEFLNKLTDVYESRIREEFGRRKKVERVLKVLTKVSEAILKTESERALLEKVCQIIVDEGYAHAWIGYAKPDGSVEPVAGYGSDYFKSIEVRWDSSSLGQGPTGRAIKEEKPIIQRSLKTRDYLWRNEAEKRGFGSSIALPLSYGKEVFGSLNVYAFEEDAFDEEERKLFERVAANLSYGIALIKIRKERERLLEQIRKNIEQFAILVDHIRNPLAAAQGFVELYVDDEDAVKKIKEQFDRIVDLVEQLEKGWVESEKIREYLRKTL